MLGREQAPNGRCVCDPETGVQCGWHANHEAGWRYCKRCGGAGAVAVRFGGEYFSAGCPDCNGVGKWNVLPVGSSSDE